MAFVGVQWRPQFEHPSVAVIFGVCWAFSGVCWCSVVQWRSVAFGGVQWREVAFVGVQWRLLVFSGV